MNERPEFDGRDNLLAGHAVTTAESFVKGTAAIFEIVRMIVGADRERGSDGTKEKKR